MSSQYIVSRICLEDEKVVISHILLDFESIGPEFTDFSQFRIPLLLLSFGVIIYVTVKNKKREKAIQDEEKMFRDLLMGQLAQEVPKGERPDEAFFEAQITRKKLSMSRANLK